MFDNLIFKHFIKASEGIKKGSLTVHAGGKSYRFDGLEEGPSAEISIKDTKALRRFIFKGDVGMAETFRDGLWDTKSIKDLAEFFLLNDSEYEKYVFGSSFFRRFGNLLYFIPKNTEKGSKQNIHAHYDIGNDFYSLWLDKTMTYSSAIYTEDTESLTDAQHNKYDRLIDQFEKDSGELLEIGCGWGGFLSRLSQKADYRAKGITISKEQAGYAKNRLKDSNSQIHLEDYRKLDGKFDHIVSIEMLEAVGVEYWQTYFSKIKSLLKSKGTALIQTITIDDQYFPNYIKNTDFIRTLIFPGGVLPSVNELNKVTEKCDLKIEDCFAFGKSYSKTLDEWLVNFEQVQDKMETLGLDDKFCRLWKFYLGACSASFNMERTDVVQLRIAHA